MDKDFSEILKNAIIEGDKDAAIQASHNAIEEGISAYTLLHDCLIAGADIVGEKFEAGEVFLPELMLTGNALKATMDVVGAKLQEEYASGEALPDETGTIVIATIQTDLHDIGKNIVSSLLTASGFDVHDLGVDVSIPEIIKKAQEVNAKIIACSALLTTSLPYMGDLINMMVDMGIRDQYKVMIGGAPVTPEFASKIGADGTSDNAIKAVQLAKDLVSSLKYQS